MITIIPFLGWIIYIIVMPYVAGRLVDWVSDSWMD
jgi:fructose-specific phosphotransferase system IIC component